jgi:hypothetical protein
MQAALLTMEQLVAEDAPKAVLDAGRHVIDRAKLGSRPDEWARSILMEYAGKRQRQDRYGK